MEPSAYSPEEHLSSLVQKGIGSILIMGSILFPALGFMDFYVSPENFTLFMTYRLAVAALLLFLYYLNGLKRSKYYQYAIGSTGAVLCAVTVELAVLRSGGQNSIYYAAFMILAVSSLGFAPVGLGLSFIVSAIVYAIYVVPIVLSEPVQGGAFASNNAFLVSTFVIGLLLRYQNQKLIETELRLRAELWEDKRTLELYSSDLKEEVAEKSGALAITEQKYRALFDYANDGIAVLDSAGNITDANLRFCELHDFQRDSLIGTNFRLLEIEKRSGDVAERLRKILAGESLVYEAEHYRKDGSKVHLEISSRAIDIGGAPHIQSFHRDITEKKKLQEQVLQSQKMESMGVLAGGIAHDFNNILTGILGHTEVLRRHVKSDEFGKKRIKTIEDAARRAGQMVTKLLSFARKESLELVPTDLNAVVKDTVELVGRALIDRHIDSKLMLEPNVPAIMGDGIHLEQVIANLIMNAMDAMPSGGAIMIATSYRRIDPELAHISPFLAPGGYVVLTIRDTGTGIPRRILDRIFDPFFTTKPAGKGTGLGLAMVYGIVKSHKGEIRVESAEGAGTVFEIYFPESEKPVLPAREASLDLSLLAKAKGETVFVVDDEKDVLSYTRDILEMQGYKVFSADNPNFAIELFQKISDEIDIVITDIVMPVMNGAELAGLLKEVKPSVKVIGMSGFDGGTIMRDAPGIDSFLKKPFDGVSLIACVQHMLAKS